MADARRLQRLLRVRAIGRDLALAEQARAADQAMAGLTLVNRIDALAASIGPAEGGASAFDLMSAAVYRGRLHESAQDARRRLSTAEALLARRTEATLDAQRDHRAIEKLADLAGSRAVRDAMRRLAEGPFPARRGTVFAEDGE